MSANQYSISSPGRGIHWDCDNEAEMIAVAAKYNAAYAREVRTIEGDPYHLESRLGWVHNGVVTWEEWGEAFRAPYYTPDLM